MTDLSVKPVLTSSELLGRPLRFVTAASLFDGHDAAINIVRRLLQSQGAEVIHLGHNRSVEEIVSATLQEDADAVAISSYQGGHVEFFKYLLDLLRERGGSHIKVFGGGGGVIIPTEIAELHAYGVARIYSPEDGARLGLRGMIEDMLRITREKAAPEFDVNALIGGSRIELARAITALENDTISERDRDSIFASAESSRAPTLGITGTGGSGKSSLCDELVRRFRLDQQDSLRIAVIAIDPSRRRSGGALLGDRIRMNSIYGDKLYMRSLATRDSPSEVSRTLPAAIAACKAAGFDLVVVETSGIGQGDTAIVSHVDLSLYVMTPEFGAASQLEKIDMLDFADFVAINKFERKGGEDALRDVRKQVQRNREGFSQSPEEMPVFGTIASRFNDDGVTALYHALAESLRERGLKLGDGTLVRTATKTSSSSNVVVPASRNRYLAEIAETARTYHSEVSTQTKIARERQQLTSARSLLSEHLSSRRKPGSIGVQDEHLDSGVRRNDGPGFILERRSVIRNTENSGDFKDSRLGRNDESASSLLTGEGGIESAFDELIAERDKKLDPRAKSLLARWPETRRAYSGDEHTVQVRGKQVTTSLVHKSLSGTRIPKVAFPKYEDDGELLKWLMKENLPGYFPYTGGVFSFKRENEDSTRLFAGEGDAFRTNRRFKLLSQDSAAKRLSTAFDSVTLYGFDPDERPDIYGKVGNSGVSIATLDDMKALYAGFDLLHPQTSVSMTINGPAPTILAMFLNTAIDQQLNKFERDNSRPPTPEEAAKITEYALHNVRGTVQADILKEDQGQNTCIFSIEFALKMMADIQEYFVQHRVRNFYSVSISGYHIAEAGANPISQLAFTLANGFTFVEAYLARGMHIDDFAPNLSFFFSNGMEPEYSVMGRVARRIWAVAMRDKYGANERSQKLKYHVQTSGRSLHAQEIAFNDIRTTLQALIAVYDNCNSLHTNAYDEAITTPTDESVRRALAIQLIINREWGLAKNENPNQGAFIIDELTDLVEEAVLKEFEAISSRGGVLGAMETGYQRGKIQEESLYYEQKKHDGSLPIIGVNTFTGAVAESGERKLELSRSTDEEKQSQLTRLRDFKRRHRDEASEALAKLQRTAIENRNIFAELMNAVRCCSLGQITDALFEVGGQYRRSM
jgi:methylmalonyl-CoA mutase